MKGWCRVYNIAYRVLHKQTPQRAPHNPRSYTTSKYILRPCTVRITSYHLIRHDLNFLKFNTRNESIDLVFLRVIVSQTNDPQTSVQGGLSGLILSWANELTSDDSESEYALSLLYMRHVLTYNSRTIVCCGIMQYVCLCCASLATDVCLLVCRYRDTLLTKYPSIVQCNIPSGRTASVSRHL